MELNTRRKTRHRSLVDFILHISAFEKLIFLTLFIILAGSACVALQPVRDRTLVEVPRNGGVYTEGLLGTPRFINPLLTVSDSDKDVASVVYAGLMTHDADGNLVPELAETYNISEDGTVYTFTLRDGIVFHDGTPITANDVLFTVQMAANPAIHSPAFAHWDGVKTEVVDDRTITFTLPEPYAPFIENTTIGILPAHIWKQVSAEEFPFSQFNITPIGAGPYKVDHVERDSSGIPKEYVLTAFDSYALGAPHIATLKFKIFDAQKEIYDAYVEHNIDALHSISPDALNTLLSLEQVRTSTALVRMPLLRVFGVFLNHNKQPLFLRDEVREALDAATPKYAIVGEVLKGYGEVLDGPLPHFLISTSTTASSTIPQQVATSSMERARSILEQAGWERDEETGIYTLETKKGEKQPLSLTLSTVQTPELERAAKKIAEHWRILGAEVEVKVFDPVDLTQSVIRPRKYEALLFGMVLGHELDLYAFWHSSQRNDPGLNIAQYADIEADALLEKIRKEADPNQRMALYRDFYTLIRKQHPAIFLYTPDFIYVVHNTVHNITARPIATPEERFDTIHTWYIQTDRIWPFVQDVLSSQ